MLFKHLRKIDFDPESKIKLCRECKHAIAMDFGNRTEHLKSMYCWPSFMWRFLSDNHNRETHGLDLWKFIPYKWRIWWLRSVQKLTYMEEISYNYPLPIFKEWTLQKNALMKAIAELWWKALIDAYDQYAKMPFVKCPWGCAEFLNETNFVPIDTLVAFYFESF